MSTAADRAAADLRRLGENWIERKPMAMAHWASLYSAYGVTGARGRGSLEKINSIKSGLRAILSQPSADSSLCGGSLLEGTRAKPPLKGEVPAACGRRGSSPHRDHNQLTRNRTQLAWAHKSEGTHKPIPSYSSGEGVWGVGASLREAASPPQSPPKTSFREGARGRGLFLPNRPLPRIFLLIK